MHENQTGIHPRQQEIDFDGDRLWQRLPEPCRRECQDLISQLLATVSQREREQQGGMDEGED
jgi:hypothetical protein